MFCNNEVELIDMSGHVLQRMEFDHNVVCATQDDDTIVVSHIKGDVIGRHCVLRLDK